MADFVQTMKDWKRMCNSCQPNCEKCGLFEMGCDTANIMNEPDRAEKIITKWAAEHPEPIYPTWFQWLKSIGALPADQTLCHRGLENSIPADIAEKLGIEPKKQEAR